MSVLRTPEARFADLPDYPFAPGYHQVTDTLRLHYVDIGPRAAAPVVMMHGEPTWSYLYGHVIPPVAAAGHRVLAPDLIGFGKSDKPADRQAHTHAARVAWVRHWVEALDLNDITLVCQDWGSLIGLRIAAEVPERFARIIVGKGGLPTGDQLIPIAFHLWKAFARWSPWFPIGRIVQGGTKRRLTTGERAAYDAPFPAAEYKAAARAYPLLVPITPDNPASEANRVAWLAFERWHKPFICCFSDGDPITRGLDRLFRQRVPGTRDQLHVTLRGGHFMQEDDPKGLAELVIEACRAAPKGALAPKSVSITTTRRTA